MNVFVDENIPRQPVDELRAAGHDVWDLRQTPQQGSPDPVAWQMIRAQQRLLITTDTGFIEHADTAHWGILIIRLRQRSPARP
jgi:predicted nuclease of predicted toxin-antitoxin system